MGIASPYAFTRSEGMVHIHMRSRPGDCVACVRTDAYEIIVAETRRQAIEEMRAAVERARVGNR